MKLVYIYEIKNENMAMQVLRRVLLLSDGFGKFGLQVICSNNSQSGKLVKEHELSVRIAVKYIKCSIPHTCKKCKRCSLYR